MSGFTPGPWFVADGGIVWAYGSEAQPVAECCGCPLPSGECCGNAVQGWEETQTQEQIAQCSPADANLIAAAPALYEALTELVECNVKRGPFDEPLGESEQTPEMNAAVLALKQARGES